MILVFEYMKSKIKLIDDTTANRQLIAECEDERGQPGPCPNRHRLKAMLAEVEALEYNYSVCTFFYLFEEPNDDEEERDDEERDDFYNGYLGVPHDY